MIWVDDDQSTKVENMQLRTVSVASIGVKLAMPMRKKQWLSVGGGQDDAGQMMDNAVMMRILATGIYVVVPYWICRSVDPLESLSGLADCYGDNFIETEISHLQDTKWEKHCQLLDNGVIVISTRPNQFIVSSGEWFDLSVADETIPTRHR